MQTDRHGNLTDDADRWLTGHESTLDYDPVPDHDGLEYDDLHRGPKCGGRVFTEDGEYVGCPGCKHCDPVDPENKPYGFGIEKFEDAALARANEVCRAAVASRVTNCYTSAWVETWGMFAGRGLHHKVGATTDADRALRDVCWRFWTKWSARRWTHSERVWGRLCDECQTHTEAVARYSAWARRAITRKYRDER